MKKIWIACGIALGNFLFAEGMNLPEPLKYFSADMKRIIPSAGKFEACGNGIFSVLDVKGKKIGKLYLEHIPDEERKMGYAGTIEIAVLFNAEDEVAGILIGRNKETPSFLNRVRAAKFLEKWNNLKMNEIPGREVDAVSGATYSSEAIRHGVRKLAESYLSESRGAEKIKITEAERIAMEREIVMLERKVKMHERIYGASEKLLAQLRTRKDDELQLRLIAALEGKEAAAAFAGTKNMMYFNHPRRGPVKKTDVEILAEKYKTSHAGSDLENLKKAILADYEAMLARVPPHNAEHAKAMKASRERIEVLKRKLAENRSSGNMGTEASGLKFRSPDAQSQEEKILHLAKNYRASKDPKIFLELKKEVVKQVVSGVAALSAKIAKEEKESEGLRKHLEQLLEDPDAVIQKRLETLVNPK